MKGASKIMSMWTYINRPDSSFLIRPMSFVGYAFSLSVLLINLQHFTEGEFTLHPHLTTEKDLRLFNMIVMIPAMVLITVKTNNN